MKTFYFLICSFLFFVTSCNDGTLSDSEVVKAKSDIINNGDKRSYALLSIYHSRKQVPDEQLAYDIIMAYKYKDADAYYGIYENMIKFQNKNEFEIYLIGNLDSTSRDLALSSLKKSSDLGNLYAKKILAKYYREGKYLAKDVIAASKLEDEIKIR